MFEHGFLSIYQQLHTAIEAVTYAGIKALELELNDLSPFFKTDFNALI